MADKALGDNVGLSVGLATVTAVAGPTLAAGKPAATSAACTVLVALVSLAATVVAFRFVSDTIVVMTTPAIRIRGPVISI
jgi:hypothetical protein